MTAAIPKMVWIETPTNPLLQILDIEAIAQVAKSQQRIAGGGQTVPSSAVLANTFGSGSGSGHSQYDEVSRWTF
jgi:cystathionine beta-lyase/cystathionine gamma-synthase